MKTNVSLTQLEFQMLASDVENLIALLSVKNQPKDFEGIKVSAFRIYSEIKRVQSGESICVWSNSREVRFLQYGLTPALEEQLTYPDNTMINVLNSQYAKVENETI